MLVVVWLQSSGRRDGCHGGAAVSTLERVCSAASVSLYNLHPDCLAEVTLEYPFLQERYERLRLAAEDTGLIDRPRAQLELYREAEKAYQANTGEVLQHWRRELLARYTRNLALTASDLTATFLFDITVAARTMVDDNFAWDVWDTAGRYPAQTAQAEIETVSISGEEVWVDTRKMRLRRRLPSDKRRLRPPGLRPERRKSIPVNGPRKSMAPTSAHTRPKTWLSKTTGAS